MCRPLAFFCEELRVKTINQNVAKLFVTNVARARVVIPKQVHWPLIGSIRPRRVVVSSSTLCMILRASADICAAPSALICAFRAASSASWCMCKAQTQEACQWALRGWVLIFRPSSNSFNYICETPWFESYLFPRTRKWGPGDFYVPHPKDMMLRMSLETERET